jgi:chaperone modulatory protein CbpM
MQQNLEMDAGALEVVFSLIDQFYDTRQRLLSLTRAVTVHDGTIQVAVIAAMSPSDGSSGPTGLNILILVKIGLG